MEREAAWYPTIFPDKCDGCAGFETPKCIEFCPHKVFGILMVRLLLPIRRTASMDVLHVSMYALGKP